MKDITGLRFGRLVVIEPVEKRDYKGLVYWRCKCDCGNEKVVNGSSLRLGNTKSCGCLRVESARNLGQNSHTTNRKHFGCFYCGSDNHYAKGCCRNCYGKLKRGTLDFKR